MGRALTLGMSFLITVFCFYKAYDSYIGYQSYGPGNGNLEIELDGFWTNFYGAIGVLSFVFFVVMVIKLKKEGKVTVHEEGVND